MPIAVRVWDLPTRVFHWVLVLCVVALFITAQIGADAMRWHFRFGYAVLTLLIFRLLWGCVGGLWSRFSSFGLRPSSLLRPLRGLNSAHAVGHSPQGSLAVIAMLSFLTAQVASGLVSDDEVSVNGPFSGLASSAVVRLATHYHTQLGKLVLVGLVSAHIAAVVFYLFRRHENLVLPMIFGDKMLSESAQSSRDDMKSRVLGLVLLSACGMLVAFVHSLAP